MEYEKLSSFSTKWFIQFIDTPKKHVCVYTQTLKVYHQQTKAAKVAN